MPRRTSNKDEKLSSLLSALAAQYLESESDRTSLITVTGAQILNRGKRAVILFTVFPEAGEGRALEFAKRKRNDFRRFLSGKKIFGFTPTIDFEIDLGEKNRQKIDSLLGQ